MENVIELYKQLEKQLENIQINADNVIDIARQSYFVAQATMEQQKKIMLNHEFKNKEEEIRFFKETKPKFYSKLIYYSRLFEIETNLPADGVKERKKFLNSKLKAIHQFSKDNIAFYQYNRSGATYMDELYFMRNKTGLLTGFDLSYFDCDPSFCTSHDYTLAAFVANELLAKYINEELAQLSGGEGKTAGDNTLNWAGTKSGCIELLYALQSLGVFYHAKTKKKADIRQVARFFETALEIDLGNYYRTFQEIRIRHNGRTTFLDKLKESLTERMDDLDGGTI